MKAKILSMLTVCTMSLSITVPLLANTIVINKSNKSISTLNIGTYPDVENNQTNIYNEEKYNNAIILNENDKAIENAIIDLIQSIKQNSDNIINWAESEKMGILDPENTSNTSEYNSEFITKVIELTNEERAKYGLEILTLNSDLCKVAQAHVEDMYNNNYFSHDSLSGNTFKDRIDKYPNEFNSYAENIAYGQITPEEVVNAWMNSEGHKANILGDYTQIGVGFCNNYWCQDFAG